MYQGASDSFAGPRDADLGRQRGLGRRPRGRGRGDHRRRAHGHARPRSAGRHIKLVLLVNDVTARALIPAELAKGFGFLHGKPASAFSPVAVTPDELGRRLAAATSCTCRCSRSSTASRSASRDAGTDMTFDFAQLIDARSQDAARWVRARSSAPARSPTRPPATRPATSAIPASPSGGCWRRSGTARPGRPGSASATGCGSRCSDAAGRSIFGAIEQEVRPLQPAVA